MKQASCKDSRDSLSDLPRRSEGYAPDIFDEEKMPILRRLLNRSAVDEEELETDRNVGIADRDDAPFLREGGCVVTVSASAAVVMVVALVAVIAASVVTVALLIAQFELLVRSGIMASFKTIASDHKSRSAYAATAASCAKNPRKQETAHRDRDGFQVFLVDSVDVIVLVRPELRV